MSRIPIMRAPLSGAASLLAALFVTTTSWAEEPAPYPTCEREPTENEVIAAKGAYDAGEVSFYEGDYERALLYWEDAFRRNCTAAKLLLNLARAYELSDDLARAILALETYLERRPDATDRTVIEKRISKLREQLDAEHAEEAAKAEAAEAEAATAETTGKKKPVWPIVLTGVGVVGLGVGIPLWITGQSDYDAVLQRWEVLGCTPQACPLPETQREQANSEAAEAKNKRTAGIALTVAGGAAAATGAVIWAVVWGKSKEESARTLTPVVTPGFAGVSYQGSF